MPVKGPKQWANSLAGFFVCLFSAWYFTTIHFFSRFTNDLNEIHPNQDLIFKAAPRRRGVLHSLILPWDEGRNKRALIDLGHL